MTRPSADELAAALHDSTWACPFGQVVPNWCDPRRGELFHVSQAESILGLLSQPPDTGAGLLAAFNDVSKYDERRDEVRALVEEADADADDGVAGPDSLADGLMEVALDWLRAALAAQEAEPKP